MVSLSLLLKALHVKIRGMVLEQLWDSSNLPFNHQARRSKNSMSVFGFFSSQKEEVWIKIFCIFLFGDTKRMGGGEEVQGKKYTREKQTTHKHTCTYAWGKKKTRDIINIWIPYANGGREQMLLHLIDLYVNCIQTFQCLFWAHCELSSLIF